ncbi:MAG: TRAP transporter substrate-binding protein [Deltaproteobacteria bacterium]|nr:TRAP transporter substrate-binding protein [Deltaproteobacteria bacterium]
MQRCLLTILSLFIALSFLAPAVSAQTVLTYSNFFPPTHAQSQLAQAWCDEVKKRTGGKVNVQYFPGQTLTPARQAYDGVVNGLSDLAMGCFAYTRGRFPAMEALDLPLGYESGTKATKAANLFVDKIKPKELDQVVVMYVHAHGPGLLFTRDKAVKSLEDIKGLKIRSHGTSAKLVKALGGVPVTLPMPDSYQALARGIVDGSFYPVESNLGWKLAETVKFGTWSLPVAYTTTFFVVMNKARWKALPEEVKTTIRQINQEWAAKTGATWDQADQKGLEFFLAQSGRKIIKLSPAEGERWRQAAQPVITEYELSSTKRGLDGKAVVKAAQEALAQASEK